MKRIIVSILIALSLSVGLAAPTYAANITITGGTNGPNCTSGGYFTPQSVTVQPGDTVTIAVPADDPYPAGIELHGFSEGNFVVLPGKSHTTRSITANVSYYGTWPSTGCMKGSGSITVAGSTTQGATTTAIQQPAASHKATTTTQSSPSDPKWLIMGGIVVAAALVAAWWILAAKRQK